MRGNCVIILGAPRVVALGFIHFLSSGDRRLRGLSIAYLLAFAISSTAVAEPSNGPASTVAQSSEEAESTGPQEGDESDRLRYKDPVITIDPSTAARSDQWAIDGFYRIQVIPEFTFGPTLQVVIDPARNDDEDVLYVGGIHMCPCRKR